MKTKALVIFKTLAADNLVVALTSNHEQIAVDAAAVEEYMAKMKELTGGTDVEFNNTFRQICKDRVFYAFEPASTNYKQFAETPFVPEVVECVLLSDDRVVMNLNGNVTIMYPQEDNTMWATKEAAYEAAKESALTENSEYLGELTNRRKELKEMLRNINAEIDKQLEFKHSLA